MRKVIIKKLLYFIISQLLILIIELLLYNKISLINYIDISFYFSSFLLLCALFIFVIQKGFFDVPAKVFTTLSSRNGDKMDEIRPLSKLFAINHKPLFFYGLLTGVCMGISLIFYYS